MAPILFLDLAAINLCIGMYSADDKRDEEYEKKFYRV